MEIFTKSAEETKEFGQKIASSLKCGSVLALSGDLGSGKTTFVQGFLESLGIKSRIISPTFVLMKEYDVSLKGKLSIVKKLYHLDLYRLENDVKKEMKNLGLDDIISNPANIILVEWAEKAKDFFPSNTTWVTFEYINGDKRRIQVSLPS